MLSPKEVSSILNVSARTVRRLAESRIIPGARKIGNVWRFDPEKFACWLADLEKPETLSEKKVAAEKSGRTAIE